MRSSKSKSKSEETEEDEEDLDSYDDEITDGMVGIDKEEMEKMIQEALTAFKTELLSGEDFKPMLEVSK